MTTIHLGYEIGTGEPVAIPLKHMAVTGQTQESGKTTTLEALISRSDLRAVAFITKRAEGSFSSGRRLRPYFRERTDWQFVSAVLEATLRERLKFERSWIMRACKGAKSLADVHRNVKAAMEKAKGLSADVYLTLDEYLAIVIPQIERLPYTNELQLQPGINVMDLSDYSMELQSLVIRSVLEWIYERERDTVIIIPEAWEFIPQARGSPVLLAAEQLIRKGAAARNFIWLDSQDIAAVHKTILRSVIVWILGVQREANEVKRMLQHIPNVPKPTIQQVMQLGRGEFFVCWGAKVKRVYVQPAWLSEDVARNTAVGAAPVAKMPTRHDEETTTAAIEEDDEMSAAERAQYEKQIQDLEAQVEESKKTAGEAARAAHEWKARAEIRSVQKELVDRATRLQTALQEFVGAPASVGPNGAVDVDALVSQVLARIPAGGAGVTYAVAPLEKLRKDYQQREVDRILEQIKAMTVTQKDIIALLEQRDEYVSQITIAARLGKGSGGWLAQHLKPLADQGFIEMKERQGARQRLRQKIAEDLAHYGATDEEIEQTYQHCLALLAAETVA